MSKYKCKNKTCSTYNKVVTETGIHLRYHTDGTISDLKAICPECKSIRELVEEDPEKEGLCVNAYGGNGNICKK